MNGNCQTCPVESQCAYPYKPTDCCDQRKFRPMKAATTMPNSLDREAFEAKFSQPPYEFEMDRCGPDSSWPGGYREYHVQCAWEGWQAGAAAEQEACAKLCDDIDTHCERYDIDRAFNSSVRRAAKAIRDRSAP